MDGFPSGQRGQTVNLLAVPSVVRIHLPPSDDGKRTKVRILNLSCHTDRCADVAQLAEQLICNQQVEGSSPPIGLRKMRLTKVDFLECIPQ